MSDNPEQHDPEEDLITITEADLAEVGDELLMVTALHDPDITQTPSGKISWNPTMPTSSKTAVDVILCIDTSGSMGANDYSPNRLSAAKAAARMFAQQKVLKNYNDRVGVVGFGGNPHTTFPPTSDLSQIPDAVANLNITHSGTMIGSALRKAGDMLNQAQGTKRAIILLSDGGDQYDSSNPIEVARSLKSVVVFTIGIGTTEGSARLPHGQQQVPLNEELLRQIAKVTGGDYVFAPDVETLQTIYAKLADY